MSFGRRWVVHSQNYLQIVRPMFVGDVVYLMVVLQRAIKWSKVRMAWVFMLGWSYGEGRTVWKV
jgi:hypothetical protein